MQNSSINFPTTMKIFSIDGSIPCRLSCFSFAVNVLKMNLVKLFLCVFLIHFARGLDSELFFNSIDETETNIACCFDIFEKLSVDDSFERRSAVILLPDASNTVQVEKVFIENSRRKIPWSFEVWQWKNHPKTIAPGKTNYIFLQSDQMTNEQFEKIISQLSRYKPDLASSLRICIVESLQKTIRKESGEDCSLTIVSNSRDGNIWKRKTASSDPFAYFDANNGNPWGIEVSLIKTVAEKLQFSMIINVNDSHRSNTSNGHSVHEDIADRYKQE